VNPQGPDGDLAGAVAGLAAHQAGGFDLAAKGGHGHRHRHGAEQIETVAFEQFVRDHRQEDVKVATRAAAGSCIALAGQTDTGPVIDAGRNTDRQDALAAHLAVAVAADAGVEHHSA